MLHEETIQVLEQDLLLKVLRHGDVWQIIGVSPVGEGQMLYVYNVALDVVEMNKPNVNALVDDYRRRTGTGLKAVIAIADGIATVVNFVAGLITSILGGIWGFGLFGILIVLILMALTLMVWMYALMIILPCTGIAFLSRMWLEKSREAAVLQLTADAREVARRALGISAKPMLGQVGESVPMGRMEVEEQMSILDS